MTTHEYVYPDKDLRGKQLREEGQKRYNFIEK